MQRNFIHDIKRDIVFSYKTFETIFYLGVINQEKLSYLHWKFNIGFPATGIVWQLWRVALQLRCVKVRFKYLPICKTSFTTWCLYVSCSCFLLLRQLFLLKSWDTVLLVRDPITTSSAIPCKSWLHEDTRYWSKYERCNPLNHVCLLILCVDIKQDAICWDIRPNNNLLNVY